MSEPRILVVDDEPFNLEIVGEYLDGMGFDLVYAESGTEAWDVLTRPGERFDLILLDRMMPGLDGISVLRQIKADEALRHIPVIMQTAATSPEQVREGLAAGAYYYLTKPFEGEALQTIIRSALDDQRVAVLPLREDAREEGVRRGDLVAGDPIGCAFDDLPERYFAFL